MILLLVACTGSTGETGDTSVEGDTTSTLATLQLRFQMDDDLIEGMDEPPIGLFHGSIYREDDATAIGMNDGAESLVDFASSSLDLSNGGGPSEAAWTSDPLDPQTLWILGCLDSDANDCECGDPITVPNDNKFAVVPGDNALTIRMELLHPC